MRVVYVLVTVTCLLDATAVLGVVLGLLTSDEAKALAIVLSAPQAMTTTVLSLFFGLKRSK